MGFWVRSGRTSPAGSLPKRRSQGRPCRYVPSLDALLHDVDRGEQIGDLKRSVRAEWRELAVFGEHERLAPLFAARL